MAISREAARALLGVSDFPSEDEVQRAFRRKAKAAHPDQGGVGGDLGRLAEARDVLLKPAPKPQASQQAAPTQRSAPEPVDIVYVDDDRDDRFGCGLVGVLAIMAFIAIVGVGVLVLVIGFIGSSNFTEGRPGDVEPAANCIRVLVVEQDVERVPCDQTDAQEIALRFDRTTGLAAACPAGTNTLDTDTTRWCLRPVTP